MTTPVSLSIGTRNHILTRGSLKNALQGGILKVFAGSMPANADAAETGTLLAAYTDAGAAWTGELLATATVTLTSGSAGQVSQILILGVVPTMASAVPFNTSLAQTASDVAAEINNVPGNIVSAKAVDATITLSGLPGSGAVLNGFSVAATTVNLTSSSTSFAGGVSAANGLLFASSSAGVLSKISSQLLQGTVQANGVAAYWRIYTEGSDKGLLDGAERYRRAQGAVGAPGSGETLIIPTTTLAINTGQRVGSLQVFV